MLQYLYFRYIEYYSVCNFVFYELLCKITRQKQQKYFPTSFLLIRRTAQDFLGSSAHDNDVVWL